MSLLPQRKKTAEEIAKLRESLGVPALPGDTPEAPTIPPVEAIVPAHHQATVVDAAIEAAEAPHIEPAPAPPSHGPKPVHSLKRSERIPAPSAEETPAETLTPEPSPGSPKLVRSLRKSEQIPVLTPAPVKSSADSKIPFHRHSDDEIAAIRRRDALAMMDTHVPNPKLAAAHPALLIPGYLLAISGASCFIFYEVPMAATAGCAAAALLISGFIFARRPISRHHAGFIAIIALLVLVFGALHFFPHLRHAT